MLFFRVIQHLLPDSAAWRVVVEKTLRRFFQGLSSAPAEARDYLDEVYLDLFPGTTREIAAFEDQFGLTPSATESARRANLAAEWAATGGQSPAYIQGVLQTAGFDVYVHDWWASGPPYVARDPRLYTTIPLLGDDQCDAVRSTQPQCAALTIEDQPQCDRFLVGDPGYIVNRTLVPDAPPPVPDDPSKWPFFMYVGGQVFGTTAQVPNERRAEFERLLLKLCPTQLWIVTLIDYVTAGVFDASFDQSFE